MKFLILAGMLLTSSAFALDHFQENRTYIHHLFRTKQDCRNAQRGAMWFNCDQSLTLHSDGTASLLLTDIMNSAVYSLVGNELVIKSSASGDMPETMNFKLDRSERNLVSNDGEVWELEQACE